MAVCRALRSAIISWVQCFRETDCVGNILPVAASGGFLYGVFWKKIQPGSLRS